jgi:hypothetical protein
VWIGALFAIGSLCFVLGPFPGFVHVVGAEADAAVFFAGSLLFTAAAALQSLQARTRRRSTDWWAAAVQLAGTLFFNLSTYRALDATLANGEEDRVIWRPDAFGSVCFLIASTLAWLEVRGRGRGRDVAWWIAAVNLAGSIAFGVSAVAGYIVPATGDVLDLAAANISTVAGALCFLAGAVLLLIDTARVRAAPLEAT